MKRIIYTIPLIFCCTFISAQSKSSTTDMEQYEPTKKELKNFTESAPAIIDYLNAQCEKLSHDYQEKRSWIAKYAKRKKPEMTEEELKVFLSRYQSFNDLAADKDNVRNALKAMPIALSESYLQILDMLESIYYTGYNEEVNKEFCKKIDEWDKDKNKPLILDMHREEYAKLREGILNYSYVMFDLARVFRKIKKLKLKDLESIKKQLDADHDLDYIELIPYAERALNLFMNHYIGKSDPSFDNLKKELEKTYPVEFKNFEW